MSRWFAYAVIAIVFVGPASAAERPNIVLIFSDDQGVNDVGCYGSEIPTPNIDRIAKEGLRFCNWYSASSICTPSRFGLLTGRNPIRSQDQLLSALMFLADDHKQRGLRAHETTIAARLRSAGYHTALLGKWHLGHGEQSFLPVHHGFDLFRGHTGGCIDYFTMTYGRTNDWYHNTTIVPRNGYATELITSEAVRYLEAHQESDRPFFLYLPYNAPHFGKGWNPSKNETVNIMQAQASDLKRVSFIEDKIRREFAAMTVSLDDGVGRILAALKETGLEEDTLLIFLTDHGGDPVYGGSNMPLRGNKATLFEGGLKVPCVMRWPGRIKAGSISDEVVCSLDLSATFCELAETRSGLTDGFSLVSHLLKDAPIPSRDLLWQTGSHAELKRGQWTAFRRGRMKYLQDSSGVEYLFDLAADPNESRDLSRSRSAELNRLRAAARKQIAAMRPDGI